MDVETEWKACVMLQESVFSISSIRHHMEDNDDEEANEDHRADEPFPSSTENSFYIQYSHILLLCIMFLPTQRFP